MVRRGFSLIELIIVIVIAGLLLSIALPISSRLITGNQERMGNELLLRVVTAQQIYESQQGFFLDASSIEPLRNSIGNGISFTNAISSSNTEVGLEVRDNGYLALAHLINPARCSTILLAPALAGGGTEKEIFDITSDQVCSVDLIPQS